MAQRQASLPADLASQPFAGRLGGNQEFILDPKNIGNVQALKRVPDASPFISLPEIFSLRSLLEPGLWKAAVTEGIGTLLLVWSTGFIAAHSSAASPPQPSPTSGIYSTPIFLGPLTGGITNMIILPLFIYSLGPVSGAHLNPMITIATLRPSHGWSSTSLSKLPVEQSQDFFFVCRLDRAISWLEDAQSTLHLFR
jgi:glycerol uptake facilitator-like aquaporin